MTERRIVIDKPDFRAYEARWLEGREGWVLLQVCEERDPESGRWEPFIAELARRWRRRALPP